ISDNNPGSDNEGGSDTSSDPLQSDSGTPSRPSLAGVWRVESELAGGGFGTTGPMTLQFPEESGGLARFLGKDAANGLTTCGDYVFAVLEGRALLLQSHRL